MIDPRLFFEELIRHGSSFFSGVPDSLLKSFCAYVTDHVDSQHHIIAANEGNAIGLAVGNYLATGNIPVVYMQNSGEGNAINPLLSLADEEVYRIPLLLVIGWRGEPSVHDEPQHVKQGKVTTGLLKTMKIPFYILATESSKAIFQIEETYKEMKATSRPYAIVVRKGAFSDYALVKDWKVDGSISREEAIECLVNSINKDAICVSTTGMASRELYEIRERRREGHKRDFLTVGSMGHASQIALGIAIDRPERQVVCIDGDGACLMHMGGMAIIGTSGCKNLIHVVINNGAHDSVGGQPTQARNIDLTGVAKACGYTSAVSVSTSGELQEVIRLTKGNGPVFIQAMVHKGARKDIGRPKSSPVENKREFMDFVQN